MAIKVVIPSAFYKSQIWCFFLFNNSHQFPICIEKGPFYDILHQSTHHWTPGSLSPCVPPLFLQLSFASVPENLFMKSATPYCYPNSPCFPTSILSHMLFLPYVTSFLPSLLGNSNSVFIEDFTEIWTLNMAPPPGPPVILSHSHMYRATL